jgi:hypothetical protein
LIGKLLKIHVKAVVIIAARFVASSVLSLRIARTGGGRYLDNVFVRLFDVETKFDGILTGDSPTTWLELITWW